MKLIRIVTLILSALILSACSQTPSKVEQATVEIVAPSISTLTGKVWYREKFTLPQGAILKVQLADVALQDAPAQVISRKTIKLTQHAPFTFSLDYQESELAAYGDYVIQARIEHNGNLLFINSTRIAAFSEEGGDIDVLVNKVSNRYTQPNARLTNTYWQLSTLSGKTVHKGKKEQAMHIIFAKNEQKVKGFSGCNQFIGEYEKSGFYLKFLPLMSTKKACLDKAADEYRFIRRIELSSIYSINGETLTLFNVNNHPLMTFSAVYHDN